MTGDWPESCHILPASHRKYFEPPKKIQQPTDVVEAALARARAEIGILLFAERFFAWAIETRARARVRVAARLRIENPRRALLGRRRRRCRQNLLSMAGRIDRPKLRETNTRSRIQTERRMSRNRARNCGSLAYWLVL
jgi:hypothetical protein